MARTRVESHALGAAKRTMGHYLVKIHERCCLSGSDTSDCLSEASGLVEQIVDAAVAASNEARGAGPSSSPPRTENDEIQSLKRTVADLARRIERLEGRHA